MVTTLSGHRSSAQDIGRNKDRGSAAWRPQKSRRTATPHKRERIFCLRLRYRLVCRSLLGRPAKGNQLLCTFFFFFFPFGRKKRPSHQQMKKPRQRAWTLTTSNRISIYNVYWLQMKNKTGTYGTGLVERRRETHRPATTETKNEDSSKGCKHIRVPSVCKQDELPEDHHFLLDGGAQIHIKRGYRIHHSSIKHAFSSFFVLHNETVWLYIKDFSPLALLSSNWTNIDKRAHSLLDGDNIYYAYDPDLLFPPRLCANRRLGRRPHILHMLRVPPLLFLSFLCISPL